MEQEDRVTRVVSTGGGWNGIVWSEMTAADADAIIGAQIRRFAAVPETWEWKYYSYDQPADLLWPGCWPPASCPKSQRRSWWRRSAT